MKMKTYTVSTLAEAVEKIKQDLGPQAMILSTRRTIGKMRWFGDRSVKLEVTAALDPDWQAPLATSATSATTTPASRTDHNLVPEQVTRLIDEHLRPLREQVRALQAELVESLEKVSVPQEQVLMAQSKDISESSELPSILKRFSESMESVEEMASPLTSVSTASKRNHGREPHDSSDHVSHNEAAAESPERLAIIDVCRSLLRHRVWPQAVQMVSEYLLEQPKCMTYSETLEAVATWLYARLPEPKSFECRDGGERIIAFLGPTGAGKTTNLVKLANDLVTGQGKKIGFITLDHSKIGAYEQLKNYASILKVPCALALNNSQLKAAIERFADLDVILIDTPGCSPRDTAAIQALCQTLDVDEPIWRALLVPAHHHEPDLAAVISQFRPLRYRHLVLSKLDETYSFGTLFNASYGYQVPLAYFTTGQRIPEDFEAATKERVIDCLLNFSGQFTVSEQIKENWEASDGLFYNSIFQGKEFIQ